MILHGGCTIVEETMMSGRNGDKARFHKDRKRKLAKRQRIQALIARVRDDESTAKAPAKS
jgi:hypothetical protein